MASKKMIIFVGKYCFELTADDRHLPEWRAAGVQIFVVENTVPKFINDIGLTKAWVFMQDLLGFRWIRKNGS